MNASTRTVVCPVCRGDSVYASSNPWRPFCSQRCREGDLGAWASESYRVEAKPLPDDGTGDGEPPDWEPPAAR